VGRLTWERSGQIAHVQEAGQSIQSPYARQVADIALHEGFDVVPVPRQAPSRCRSREGGGIAARGGTLGECGPQPIHHARLEAAAEQRLQEPRGAARQLALRERVQAKNLHTAGEKLRSLRHEQHVRGAREQEPAGNPPSLDGGLECREDRWGLLHLVENAPLGEIGHEPCRVRLRGPQGYGVVKGEVDIAPWVTPPIRASVVFPHCRGPWPVARGPWIRTTGVSESASTRRACANRG